MTARHHTDDYIHAHREDQLYDPHVADPYQTRKKWHEPTSCPDCGAVYHKGRWQWIQMPENSEAHRCPACARIRDGVAAGLLQLDGEFFVAHREEMLSLVNNLAIKEKLEHPLERIMDIVQTDDAATISFTGFHLTRGVGEAIHHAYQGELDIEHNERSGQMRVTWHR